MFDAVKEHVLNVGLLRGIECGRRSQLLVILLELLELLLQDTDVEVARTVVSIEEPADPLLCLGP